MRAKSPIKTNLERNRKSRKSPERESSPTETGKTRKNPDRGPTANNKMEIAPSEMIGHAKMIERGKTIDLNRSAPRKMVERSKMIGRKKMIERDKMIAIGKGIAPNSKANAIEMTGPGRRSRKIVRRTSSVPSKPNNTTTAATRMSVEAAGVFRTSSFAAVSG